MSEALQGNKDDQSLGVLSDKTQQKDFHQILTCIESCVRFLALLLSNGVALPDSATTAVIQSSVRTHLDNSQRGSCTADGRSQIVEDGFAM